MSFLTVKQTAEKYPFNSQNSLRWIIFNSKSNGATAWLRKIGRKILIDDEGYISWINNQREV
jgi:hypothetical protein